MTTKGKNLFFLKLWAIYPIVEMISGMTQYPNQINNLFNLFVLLLGLKGCASKVFLKKLFKWSILPFFYVFTFIMVSYWGENFANSVRLNVLFLPLYLINFTIWFIVGFLYHEELSLKYLYRIAIYFGMSSLILSMVGIINAEETRVISGLDIPIAIPPAAIYGNNFLLGVLFLVSFFSIKKTVVICSAIGIAMSFSFNYKNLKARRLAFKKKHSKYRISNGVALLLLIFSSFVLISIFYPFLSATISRFFEGEDTIRASINLVSLDLLVNNFPSGIGYNNFGYLTSDILPYTTYTQSGDPIQGVSLHNSFMHFALEGGAAVLIIAILLYGTSISIAITLMKNRKSNAIGKILIIWLTIGLVYGLFQQFHSSRYFFGLFAFGYGVYERYRLV